MSARRRWFSIFVIALAFALRVAALDLRPAHFDEGVNGAFVDGMRTEGCYRYDPANYHGPLHFYTLFAAQQLFGRSRWVLRMPTVLIGTALVALMLAFRRFLPWRAVWIGAVAAAISPAMVFYSRYAIHEMWMPFFTLLAVYGCFGIARREGRIGDLWAFGTGLSGMVLTKETYLIHWIAAALALVATRCLDWLAPLTPRVQRPRPADLFSGRSSGEAQATAARTAYFTGRQIATVTFTCIAAVLLFQSGFGMNWPGVTGLFETFHLMVAKGTTAEAGHNKEFFYWVKLMAWYEWPALLGLAAAPLLSLRRSPLPAATLLIGGALLVGTGIFSGMIGIHDADARDFLKPELKLASMPSFGLWLLMCSLGFFAATPAQNREIRWLCLYGLASFTAYSLIPYKTPWCIINLLWPFFFALGQLAENLTQTTDRRLVYAVGLLLAWTPLRDCWSLNFDHPTSDGERYAYVHTTPDINKVLRAVRMLAHEDPLQRQMHGLVLTEAFPLTWELNEFPNITYVAEDETVENYDADFVLLPAQRELEFEDRVFGIYFKESCRLRNGVARGWLYLAADRFSSLFPGRTPEIHPRVSLKNPALPEPSRK